MKVAAKWHDRWQRLSASPYFAYVLVAPLAVVLWGYVVQPMLATFLTSIRDDSGITLRYYEGFLSFRMTTQMEALLTTLGISVLSVITCAVVGVGMAFLLNRFEFPGRRLLESLALVPMALPPLIGVYAFMFLYSSSGIIPRAIKVLFDLPQVPFALKGLTGVLVVHTFTMYPYFYTAAAAALAGFDPSLEEAALNLGARRWQVWTRVILPMLTPALVSGSLLTFMVSMASYTAPLIFGVDRTMTMQIAIARTNGNLPLASAEATILSVVSIAFLILMRWYQNRRTYRSLSKGVSVHRTEVKSPVGRILAMVGAVLGTLVLILPIITLALISLSKDGTWTVQVLPPKYTLENYVNLFNDPRAWRPIKNSLQMSGIATAGSIVLGVAAAYALNRLKFTGKSLLDMAVMLPWALPGTVVGINLIAAFNQPSAFSFGQVLVGTFWILPLAYFVRFSPLVFRSSNAALAHLDPSVEEAARSLGAGWWYAFRRVTFPLMFRGVLAGALLAFVQGVGEFVASVLIYTARNQPISVEINNLMYSFKFGTAAAYGMLQILLILLVLFISRRLDQRENLA
ncbi:ABC transporter permease [Symbiobacterium terraclitae]|uniref:ABC transporter permease n=1 Tax=Symbiobacterium terraclitae TaxID=557451 RepID=UPI0035B52A10